MKRKNNSSQPVTKDCLKKELSILETRIEIKLDQAKREIDENARNYRDQVLTSNDKLAKTLQVIREDIEIGNFHTGERIDGHEKRIRILEKIQQTA